MKEYIDKVALVEVMESLVNLAKLHVKSGKTESEIWKAIHMTQLEERQDILTLIQNLPNINNEIETVVRCRECKRWGPDPDSYGKDDGPKGKCMKSFEETYDDDFCSYGQRKEAEHEVG